MIYDWFNGLFLFGDWWMTSELMMNYSFGQFRKWSNPFHQRSPYEISHFPVFGCSCWISVEGKYSWMGGKLWPSIPCWMALMHCYRIQFLGWWIINLWHLCFIVFRKGRFWCLLFLRKAAKNCGPQLRAILKPEPSKAGVLAYLDAMATNLAR